MRRDPALKMVLSHGGGFLPYAATRFAVLRHALDPNTPEAQVLAALKSFYFDTALVGTSGLPSLLRFASVGHVVFGTDYCYVSPAACLEFTRNLDTYDGTREINWTRSIAMALVCFPV